jgi:hypothetical protein
VVCEAPLHGFGEGKIIIDTNGSRSRSQLKIRITEEPHRLLGV